MSFLVRWLIFGVVTHFFSWHSVIHSEQPPKTKLIVICTDVYKYIFAYTPQTESWCKEVETASKSS